MPIGYTIDKNKKYQIDETTAPAVKKIFEMYASGETLKSMAEYLNNRGFKTSRGKAFTTSSFGGILRNKKYIGIYEDMGVNIPDSVPRLISDELFNKVQEKLKRNRHAPASNKTDIDFYLTGKLFCGKCGSNMSGDSGTSHTKDIHYYYSCVEKKRKHGCTKKSVRKDWIEQYITDYVINYVLTDENIDYLSEKAYELYEKERKDTSELTSLKNMLKDTQRVIDNIMKAIEQGIITDTTRQRMLDAEERKKDILYAIAKEEIKKPIVKKEHIEYFLRKMKNISQDVKKQRDAIINTFINAIYLYDDKMLITFNLQEGESLKKLELSTIEGFGFEHCGFTKSEP